jgi:ribosomal protein S18 acetylase RimI-like enzyme
MWKVEPLRDRERIETFLRCDAGAHVYPIADLDDVFWPDSRWFGGFEDGELRALCLLLDGLRLPILYAVCPADHAPTRRVLEAIRDELPRRLFYNLGPGLETALGPSRRLEPHGTYWKMHLPDPSGCEAEESGEGVALGPEDFDELRAFLDRAYLAHEMGGLFFEPRMLEAGCYRAIRLDGRIVAAGGVHVHSKRYGVAAIGNVVTQPDLRGRGLGRKISAAVVLALRDIETIGLNVKDDNEPALRCYQRLGFRKVCPYEEGVAVLD